MDLKNQEFLILRPFKLMVLGIILIQCIWCTVIVSINQ